LFFREDESVKKRKGELASVIGPNCGLRNLGFEDCETGGAFDFPESILVNEYIALSAE